MSLFNLVIRSSALIIFLGVFNNFPKCRKLLCSWHIQKNLISKFSNLSQSDPELYNRILHLPFTCQETNFQETIDQIERSKYASSPQKDYLEKKLLNKEKWGKCFTKKEFAGGVSTTSRVEGLHSVQKKYLTSSSNLQKVFYSFRSLEKQQVSKFYQEYSKILTSDLAEDIASLKVFKDNYSTYIYKRISSKYKMAIDYTKENTSVTNSW